MNKLLILLLMTSSVLFFFMETPLSMGLILMIQTILTVLMTGMLSLNFWYAYILFLIMIGGMLILFIYVSSLSSNLKFTMINKKKILLMMIILFTLIFTIMLNTKFYLMFNNELINMTNLEMENNFILKMSMNKLYNKPTNWIMIMMINYLLLTLLIVVKIININMGPLRKFL
nr:NADH dehydrogenase subunit 6 [Metallus sp.]